MSGWTNLTGGGFEELLKKNSEAVAIQKYAQEGENRQRVSEFYEMLTPATIASAQMLTTVHSEGFCFKNCSHKSSRKQKNTCRSQMVSAKGRKVSWK
jgi:hypothetical protein